MCQHVDLGCSPEADEDDLSLVSSSSSLMRPNDQSAKSEEGASDDTCQPRAEASLRGGKPIATRGVEHRGRSTVSGLWGFKRGAVRPVRSGDARSGPAEAR